MKLTIVAAALAALLAAAALALAAPRGDGPDGFGLRGSLVRTLMDLDLSAAQKHQAALVLKDRREELRASGQAAREAFHGLGQVMQTAPGDEAAIRAACAAVARTGEEAAVARGRVLAGLQAVLTPEQLARLQSRRELLHERLAQRLDAGRALMDDWIELHATGDASGAGPGATP